MQDILVVSIKIQVSGFQLSVFNSDKKQITKPL